MIRRWFLRIAAAALLCAVIVVVAGYFWLRTSLPSLSGDVQVAGLETQVEVIYDVNGIPHIHAASVEDAYLALGFVHARDRMFQMDFMRRLGAGRLAEVVGAPLLRVDRTMRTLGVYQLAGETYRRMPEDARRFLEAYANGVNAFLADPQGALPPEFQALRYRPEPWRPEDSMVWGRLMGQILTGNWRTEALRAALSGQISPELMQDLWPDPDRGIPSTLSAVDANLTDRRYFAELLRAIPESLSRQAASNWWVLDGRHTESGKPLLANDPHLRFNAPGLWYLARVSAPGLTLTGATVAGVPFHVLGHNGRIAWGMTTTGSDTQDLFLERLSDGSPDHYDGPEGPLPFTKRAETIQVRGQDEPVSLLVRETRHGPVISDVDPRFQKHLPPGQVVTLSSVGLRPDDTTPLALLRLNQARSWPDFRAALAHFHAPQQNISYADIEGNIGFMAPGRVPVRRDGNGSMPVPGWSGSHDWTGFIPVDELPQAFNPTSGRLVNTNHDITPPGYRWYLTRDWYPAYRAERVLEHLASLQPRTPETAAALQNDALSRAATSLLPLLLQHIRPSGERSGRALDVLRSWNGNMNRSGNAPLIFVAWLLEINRGLYADELGEYFEFYHGLRPNVVERMITQRTVWCDDTGTEVSETCIDTVTSALERALDDLEERFGSDMEDWRWGEAHPALFRHPLFGRIPILRHFSDIRIESDGGNFTVNRAASQFSGGKDHFANTHGPGYRAIYDLGNLEDSLFAVATGSSGNPLSSRYDNTTRKWRDGDYLRIAQSRERAATDAMGILRLIPSAATPGH